MSLHTTQQGLYRQNVNSAASSATTTAGNSIFSATGSRLPSPPVLLGSSNMESHMSGWVPASVAGRKTLTTGDKFQYAGVVSHTDFTSMSLAVEDYEAVSRYVLVADFEPTEWFDEVSATSLLGRIKNSPFLSSVVGVKKLDAVLGFIIRFDNVSEAFDAYHYLIHQPERKYSVMFADNEMFHTLPEYETPLWVPEEAQLIARLTFKNSVDSLESSNNAIRKLQFAQDTVLYEIQSNIGGIWHIEESSDLNARFGRFEFCLEMDAVSMADKAVRQYRHGVMVQRVFDNKIVDAWLQVDYVHRSHQDPMMFLEDSCPFNLLSKRLDVLHVQSSPQESITQPNSVRTSRILAGLEFRTTVMLRNIPNKLQTFDLIRILNSTSAGKFDFVYLRVDFQNQCNVGYAFVNFVDPADIVPFYEAFNGRRWEFYNSNKVALVCYATIQGKDALIDQFRNSGVQAQWAPFRARIFVSDEDYLPKHMVGEVAPFPAANNAMRLRQSLKNAQHVGLYQTRRGNAPNDHTRLLAPTTRQVARPTRSGRYT